MAIEEECGVFGVFRPEAARVALDSYYALYALQHRGQESCGIVVNDDGVFAEHRDLGLVGDVFSADVLERLGTGEMATGHVRYGTTGARSRVNAQPLVVNHMKGTMALAHNGNLANAAELRRELEGRGSVFQTSTDTEVISYEIIHARLKTASIEAAIEAAMGRLVGAYSLVVMSPKKLLAVRDPHGFRPLCVGTLDDGGVVFASETCALHAVGATYLRDVEPGEIVIAERPEAADPEVPIRLRSIRTHCGTKPHSACVFEYIYFARPDSDVDGMSVHIARQRAGRFLARAHPVEADIVVGVPDSGLDAAMGFARESNIPYDTGFIKNKYIGRTFISPGQSSRERGVRIKLNPVPSVVAGKRVVLVDDSIVRGTTSKRIIGLLREAGATEVHFRVSAPPFLNPCYYGTDIDSRDNLIACHMSQEEIREDIGADSLGYLSIDDARAMAEPANIGGFCTACFDGNYPTPVRDPEVNRYTLALSTGKPKSSPKPTISQMKETRP
ncbi:amidophosphoribosyltransferase [Trueperella pyogenes]|uniref:amidophosphoribosyltransferase n=1 Tax=Trueperella pyogenes TaxID=1661 RepID=UPI00215D5043|nr:amidophosphoribosyltransferase [Trueperella pyogenes]MDF2420264.1 amidophosphoribosyltransferase [Trueperella pyogenes]UVJ59158.1 amidophosphoribosyltransferase [Trueperella pyogenes]WHU59819.1 amidophosphoribosyltransferase [Trueperella pyogenes]